jgi:hypothetical protein
MISLVHAETTNLLAIADTRLSAQTPDINEGTAVTFVAGTQGTNAMAARNHGVLRFDLAGRIPAGALVTSVRLSLSVANSPNLSFYNFDLRRVLKPWAETEATWMIRLAPNVAWDTPGGMIGTDFSQTISASQMIGSTNTYVFGSTSNLVADVQNWLNHPDTNFGWVLMTTDEEINFSARRFASRENTVRPLPTLEVQYTASPPPRIDLVERMDATIRLHFTIPATFCYDVQYRDSLPGNSWSTMTNICAPVTAKDVVITDSLSASPQRFYRLAVTDQVR